MRVPKTSRPYQERFLDGFDRSQLRQEVQKVKPKGFASLRKKYAPWALGGALALGGLGVPLSKFAQTTTQPTEGAAALRAPSPTPQNNTTTNQIAGDLQTAKQIADQVAGGVQGAVSAVAETAASAPAAVAQEVAQAPQAIAKVAGAADQVRQAFFAKEVPFGSIIYSEAKKNDIAPELVAAVAQAESKFVPTARSNRGAVGLMQLVPKTGRWLGATDLTNPSQNIMAGAKYLKYLSDRFNGNQDKMIAAYNAGEGNVRRFGGIPPFRETRDYVQRVRSFQRDLGSRVEGQVAEVGSPGL
jgi:soluble lytic murein transglycosylase-like protein